jgi:DNA-directed RNA polymerase specialized sigma subunit
MTNPVNSFLTAQQQRNQQKREETQQLWHAWHDNGRLPEHMEPMIQNFQGLIGVKIKEWKPPTVPKSAFEAELTKHVIKAIESYDPNRGASLNTHVNYRVQKAKRYMVQQQNMARIPEAQAYRIGTVQRAQDELADQFGRPPTHAEIAEHMTENDLQGKKYSPKQIGVIIKAQRRDIPSSEWESDPEPQQVRREQEVLPLLRGALTEPERSVFDHIYGHEGTPVISSTGQLATRLGMSPSQVSRLKSSIATKYKKYI